MKKLITISLFSLVLISSLLFTINHISASQNTTKLHSKHSQHLDTFTYTITTIDKSDYYGKAKDGTGIYFTQSELTAGQTISKGDTIKAYFKHGSYEDIVKIVKIK